MSALLQPSFFQNVNAIFPISETNEFHHMKTASMGIKMFFLLEYPGISVRNMAISGYMAAIPLRPKLFVQIPAHQHSLFSCVIFHTIV